MIRRGCRPLHILIVDDERCPATMMGRRLVEERHAVDVLRDGITGPAPALATSSYDVLILDVRLPGPDGLESPEIGRGDRATRVGHDWRAALVFCVCPRGAGGI